MLWSYEEDGIPWVSTLEWLVGIHSRDRPTPSMLKGFRPAEVTRIRGGPHVSSPYGFRPTAA